MEIKTLDYTKYKRFFAFGCSFTEGYWPTWADMIGRHIPYYENWGMGAAGNQFIFNSIVECNKRHKFDKDDLVIVMWTSCSREDRYVDGKWLHAATEQRKEVYGKEWYKRFGNEARGNMIRDFAVVDAAQQLLNHAGVDWVNFNSMALIRFNIDLVENDIRSETVTVDAALSRWIGAQTQLSQGIMPTDPYLADTDVVLLYKDMFTKIKPPIEYLVHKNRHDRPNFGDRHATPLEGMEYLNTHLPNNLYLKNYCSYWEDVINRITVKDKLPVPFKRGYPTRL